MEHDLVIQRTSYQGSKLTFSFGSQLATNGKNLGRQIVNFGRQLILYNYNLHKNTILYVTLHARKVTIEERKQLKTTRVTLSYKATVVLRWYVSGPKVMVVSIVILNEAKHKTF